MAAEVLPAAADLVFSQQSTAQSKVSTPKPASDAVKM